MKYRHGSNVNDVRVMHAMSNEGHQYVDYYSEEQHYY